MPHHVLCLSCCCSKRLGVATHETAISVAVAIVCRHMRSQHRIAFLNHENLSSSIKITRSKSSTKSYVTTKLKESSQNIRPNPIIAYIYPVTGCAQEKIESRVVTRRRKQDVIRKEIRTGVNTNNTAMKFV